MNAFLFFNAHFGRRLVAPSNGPPHLDAWRALKSRHPLRNGKTGRLSSGWAIVRPTGAVLQQKLAVPDLRYDDRTRFDAFAAELAAWDGGPRLFLVFDKSPIPAARLFLTLDLRAVRICAPGGVETFDWTRPAPPGASRMRRELDARRARDAA